MALIPCPECGREVSTQAPSCPHCGNPITAVSGTGRPLTTIQETSKPLKLQIVISVAMFVVGFVWFWVLVSDEAYNTETPSVVPYALVTIGLIWFIVTKIRIWWHHK